MVTQVAMVVFPVAYTFSLNNAVLAMGSALLVGVGSSFFLPCANAVDIVYALRVVNSAIADALCISIPS